ARARGHLSPHRLDPLAGVRGGAATRRRRPACALGRLRTPEASRGRRACLALRRRPARRALVRGRAGVRLALVGLVPLGWGVLLLTGTRVRLGLGVFTGMAAAMVLLPPFVYFGLSPTVPLVLALGAVVFVLGLVFRRPAPLGGGRVELLPLLVLAA